MNLEKKQFNQFMEACVRVTTRNCRTPVVYDQHDFAFDHPLLPEQYPLQLNMLIVYTYGLINVMYNYVNSLLSCNGCNFYFSMWCCALVK